MIGDKSTPQENKHENMQSLASQNIVQPSLSANLAEHIAQHMPKPIVYSKENLTQLNNMFSAQSSIAGYNIQLCENIFTQEEHYPYFHQELWGILLAHYPNALCAYYAADESIALLEVDQNGYITLHTSSFRILKYKQT